MARILVAEDEKSLAELVVLNLTDAGHDVTVAEDGRYALKALMQTPPVDLVVLDLMMPWSDGFDVLRNMGSARPKVVVLTSRDDAYSERRANELGIDAYLVKPYDPEELSATVTRLLGPSAPTCSPRRARTCRSRSRPRPERLISRGCSSWDLTTRRLPIPAAALSSCRSTMGQRRS